MNKNFDIATLLNSVTHASIIILSYLIGIPGTVVYYISITYYITDTCYEIIRLIPFNNNKSMKFRLFNLGIFIHHAVIIYSIKYLSDETTGKAIFYAYYLAELSNFPMYIVHYLKKIKYPNQIVVNLFVLVEVIAYIYLRLYLCGYHAYLLLFDPNMPYTIIITSWIILIISAIWTWKLIQQVYSPKPKPETVTNIPEKGVLVGSKS